MLPSFPKTQKVIDEAFFKRMFAAKNKAFPLELHPPVHHIQEGKNTNFQRDDRQIKNMEMKKHSMTVSHSIADGRGMTLGAFDQKANEMGEGIGKQMLQSIFGVIEEAVKESGNTIKVKKGDLKQEDILKMLEITLHNYDEHGRPTPQLVCSPEFADEMRKKEAEWMQDPNFAEKLKEIKRKKREEFNEREARRRLVD